MRAINTWWSMRSLSPWKHKLLFQKPGYLMTCHVKQSMQLHCGRPASNLCPGLRMHCTGKCQVKHRTSFGFLRTSNLTFHHSTRQFSVCQIHPLNSTRKPTYLSTAASSPRVSFVMIVPRRNIASEIGAKIRGIQKDISPLSTKRIVRRKRAKDAMPKDQAIFEVTAYSTAEEYNLESLKRDLERQGLYQLCKLPKDAVDAMHVSAKYRIEDEMREIFFFREGSVVFWNMPEAERQNVLIFLQRHQEDSYDTRLIQEEYEMVEYCYTDTHTMLSGDEIQLKKSNHSEEMDLQLEKFTFANALALSVKLSIWEASLAKCVDSYESLFQDLKEGRQLKISRSEVLRIMGEVYTLRHLVNLSSDLLDTPDFYWDRDRLEHLYTKTTVNFNVPRRVKVINEKLNLSCEMLNLLFSQKNDEHHVRLEWMIIILILVEVLFEVSKLISGHG